MIRLETCFASAVEWQKCSCRFAVVHGVVQGFTYGWRHMAAGDDMDRRMAAVSCNVADYIAKCFAL